MSSMSVTSELGISPVLLQAISHTLTSTETEKKKFVERNLSMEQKGSASSRKVVSHILEGMNEPVASLLQAGSGSESGNGFQTVRDSSDEIKNMLHKVKRIDQDISQYDRDTGDSVYVGGQPMSMVNVLTALASQHLKSKSGEGDEVMTTDFDNVKVEPDPRQQSNQQIIIYYNNEGPSVPSPGNDIVVGDVEGGTEQMYRVVVQQEGNGNVEAEVVQPTEHQAKLIAEHERQMVLDKQVIMEKRARLMAQHETAQTVSSQSGNTSSTIVHGAGQDPSAIEHLGTPCPVCGDKISGYHYGIFTCESCKGFFKRTVQNKKTFVCHRHGECDITIFNRKKCPACRFAKCVQCGMKLEAIRLDRTRGGRSSYDGCSAHGRTKSISTDRKIKRSSVSRAVPPGQSSNCNSDVSVSHLVAILNHSTPSSQQSGEGGTMQVPELLTDIMNLEPLLSDEEIPLDMIPEGFEENEDSLYTYLMQLTELRLYKLVRWARNLPQFGAISTDDQILLLQNCWSDLLALGVCWRSIATPGVLSLSAGKTIGLKRAQDLGFDDVVSRMISLSEHLRRLEVDQYEYVAMKVLLLISPDVKGLKDPGKIMEHQEKLLDALLTYTTGHFQMLHNKFGEMLLRLPELSRISFIGKEQLLSRLPTNMTSCGLLVELLKGENAAKDI
ncbi:nuclear hormone receptor FTZ-F1 beta-like [Haliotis asinina]|uniref:nuclear hormone receptor FTZ-F1 beta-like n=1 Tax=Haliotis asinina TaxID=109174 RepID=UPI00353254C8